MPLLEGTPGSHRAIIMSRSRAGWSRDNGGQYRPAQVSPPASDWWDGPGRFSGYRRARGSSPSRRSGVYTRGAFSRGRGATQHAPSGSTDDKDILAPAAVVPWDLGSPTMYSPTSSVSRPSYARSETDQKDFHHSTADTSDSDSIDDTPTHKAGAQYAPGNYPTPELFPYPMGRYHILNRTRGFTSAAIQSALDSLGERSTLYLPQQSRWAISSPIILKHNQEIATWEYPTDEKDMALLEAESVCESYMLNCDGVKGARIRNLVIDEGRERFDIVQTKKNYDMVRLGSKGGNNQVMDHCIVRHPRQWTCCHVAPGAHNVKITNNFFGPAGDDEYTEPGGCLGDGLSYVGSNGLVAGNQVVDATKGAIVVFGAPGTLVTSNTIVVRSRAGYGGIIMVEQSQHDGSYEGTCVTHNTISIQGSYLRTGICQGSPVFWPERQGLPVRGGTVMYNLIESRPIDLQDPGAIGFGYAVAQVENWTCVGNVSAPNVLYQGVYSAVNRNSGMATDSPKPFIKSRELESADDDDDPSSAGNRLQRDFVEGNALGLIRIGPIKY